MALQLPHSFPFFSFTKVLQSKRCVSQLGLSYNIKGNRNIHCQARSETSTENIIRRSGNFKPSIWEYDYLQSITSPFQGEFYEKRVDELKGKVRTMFEKMVDPLDQFELVDTLQRLGIAYHFETEVKESLMSTFMNTETIKQDDLYATALAFRLKRQHGFHVPQEIFTCFMDKEGKFKACLGEDTKGLLYLYEASFLCVEGESILEEAKNFATEHLEEYVKQGKDNYLSELVKHSLELPLYKRMLRLEARWFIDIYERLDQDMNHVLLELAKLDYNVVQAIYQTDLKNASTWWKNTSLKERLSFARDRMMENFLWTVGITFYPPFGKCRRMVARVNALITTIDDIYDIYGTLDELELFTDVVSRWDLNAMEQLPEYMKICFFALHNTINDMAYECMKEQGTHAIPYLKKAWVDLCKAYLVEAKWYYGGYIPTLREYMDNAWISIGAHVILVHAYFFVTGSTATDLSHLQEYHSVIHWASVILRLMDDLGTSSDELERGDIFKAMQCYMHETKASEEDARKHIHDMLNATWKKMNEDRMFDCPFPSTFVNAAVDLGRMAQCMYQHGDGHTHEDHETKDRVFSLIIEPIPLM